MQTSEQGIALIKRFEGFSAKPYLCPAGKTTIGYGHVIGSGERFPPAGISPAEAEALLVRDVRSAEAAVGRCITMPLSQQQFDALVSFCYNVGSQAFEKSKLVRLINQALPGAAAEEFGRWVHVGGRKMPGLIKRRKEEYLLFIK